MSASVDEIRERLEQIVEELADLAIHSIRGQLRSKSAAQSDALDLPERQITRARRAVEKAVHLLSPVVDLDEE